jgi:pimeloyl-ACP methyl ester carboxylesterase
VKFLILDVGPAVTVEEQELNRVEYSMRADEVPEPDIAEALAYTKLMFKVAYAGDGRAELNALVPKIRNKDLAKYVQLVESSQDLEDWKLIRYDPAPVLKKTTIPVLSLFGEKDVLVPPKENRDKMERYLREAGNTDVTIHVIPNVGHDMESFATLKGGEWKWPEKYWVWAKKSPLFYETIIAWLVKHRIAAK